MITEQQAAKLAQETEIDLEKQLGKSLIALFDIPGLTLGARLQAILWEMVALDEAIQPATWENQALAAIKDGEYDYAQRLINRAGEPSEGEQFSGGIADNE